MDTNAWKQDGRVFLDILKETIKSCQGVTAARLGEIMQVPTNYICARAIELKRADSSIQRVGLGGSASPYRYFWVGARLSATAR